MRNTQRTTVNASGPFHVQTLRRLTPCRPVASDTGTPAMTSGTAQHLPGQLKSAT